MSTSELWCRRLLIEWLAVWFAGWLSWGWRCQVAHWRLLRISPLNFLWSRPWRISWYMGIALAQELSVSCCPHVYHQDWAPVPWRSSLHQNAPRFCLWATEWQVPEPKVIEPEVPEAQTVYACRVARRRILMGSCASLAGSSILMLITSILMLNICSHGREPPPEMWPNQRSSGLLRRMLLTAIPS